MKMEDLQALGLDETVSSAVLDLYAKEEAARVFENLLESSIQRYKGRNSKAIRAMLDLDNLRSSDNQEQAIDTALFHLCKDESYLFGPVELPPLFAAGTGTAQVVFPSGRDDGFVSELNGNTAPPRNLNDVNSYI